MLVNKLFKEIVGCMSWVFCLKYKWKGYIEKYFKRNKNVKLWSFICIWWNDVDCYWVVFICWVFFVINVLM